MGNKMKKRIVALVLFFLSLGIWNVALPVEAVANQVDNEEIGDAPEPITPGGFDVVIRENNVDYLYRAGQGEMYLIKDDWASICKDYVGYMYADGEGKVVKNQWCYLEKPVATPESLYYVKKGEEKAWYYFDENGYIGTNINWQAGEWLEWNNHWYYLNGADGMQTGWQYIDHEWYYFIPSGEMQTGWCFIAGRWFYFDANGKMKDGWVYHNGKWYYLQEHYVGEPRWENGSWYGQTILSDYGFMRTGWYQSGDGTWYYSNESGEMQTGWVQTDGVWYYLSDSGAMQTGWIKDGEDWYYLKDSGAMACNEKLRINKKTYTFTASGAMK